MKNEVRTTLKMAFGVDGEVCESGVRKRSPEHGGDGGGDRKDTSEVESYIHTHTSGMSERENERRNEFMTLYFLFNNYLNPFNFNIIIFYFNF